MDQQNLQRLFSDKKVRYGIIGFGILVAVIILLWIIILILKPATLSISPTNLSLNDGITVSENKLIAYNGSSFIEISPENEEVKTLYTPDTRFPSVKSINYAEGTGMLLTFSGNIIETPVFDYKINQSTSDSSDGPDDVAYGSDLTSDNNYTWFLDFKSKQLVHVMDQEIDSRLAYYNANDGVFYFVTGDEYDGYTDFRSYNPQTQKISTISNDLDFKEIKSLEKCGDSTCLIGSKPSQDNMTFLSKISSSGKISEVKKVEGDILQTPNENTYAYLTEPVSNEELDTSDISEDDYHSEDDYFEAGTTEYQKLTINNIASGESSGYQGGYSSGGSIGYYDDHFYYMSGVNGTYQYLKRSSHDIEFNFDSESNDFNEGFINLKMSNQNFSLVADTDREVYIVSKQSNPSVFEKADTEQVSKNIDQCAEGINSTIVVQGEDDLTADFEVDFEIMVPDDSNFNKTIHSMNTCIAKNTENLMGYSYIFTGVSPLNGKITTE